MWRNKKIFFGIFAAAVVFAASGAARAAASTVIGPYYWGGTVSGYSGSGLMSESSMLSKNLGAKAIRIYMGPKADIDYYGGSCIPNFTLAGLAARSDFNAILSDPQFSTIIITAFDGASFGDCNTKNYLNPSFYTAANTANIQKEYADFANYLGATFPSKKFIIQTREGDNDIYCGAAFGANASSCPSYQNNLSAYKNWINARTAGIRSSGAANVLSGLEFNIVHYLKNNGLPSVLYDVAPAVNADFYSYSSYESINISPSQLSPDIDTIKGILSGAGKNAGNFMIGEFGFQVGAFGNAAYTANLLTQVANVISGKGLPYGIVWALLDNPPGFGMYDSSGAITASGQAIKNVIIPPAISPTISSCGEITNGGNYVLDRDISSNGTTCLNVYDVSNVSIDCANHSINGGNIKDASPVVSFKNVNNFSLAACAVNANTSDAILLSVKNSAGGTINNNTIGYNINIIGNNITRNYVDVKDSSGLTIKNNTFNSFYQQNYTNGSVIENNSFNPLIGQDQGIAAVIISNNGSNTQIIGNNLDGKATDVVFVGADDGIGFQDEHDDVIQNNVIKNDWDCAIETSGLITNTVMSGNRISNTGVCGIGGWHYSSWKSNMISQNTMSNVPKMFHFFNTHGLRPQSVDGSHTLPADTYVYFTDNTFDGNKLLSQNGIGPPSNVDYEHFTLPNAGERAITPDLVIMGNNKFSNNDFSVSLWAPYFAPVSKIVVDGGGNRCGSVDSANNPLVCSNLSSKFVIGDRVETTANVNVRNAPSTSGSILIDQPSGAQGTVIRGPVAADGFNWWQINFGNPPNGWIAEDFPRKQTAPSLDTTPPSVPTGLTASAISSSEIDLSWVASTDNVGVAGYDVYRNGAQIASVTNGTSYSDTGLTPSTAYSYAVAAFDAAGNTSAQSAAASATTQAGAPVSTKFAIGDRVQVTATVNVRATPTTSGSILGSQSVGALGAVVGGPVAADGFNWWQIDYDSAPDGWSVEDNLAKAAAPAAGPTFTTETHILSAGPVNLPSCSGSTPGCINQSVSNSMTFSDEPNRLLYSVSAGGVGGLVGADDVLFIHGNTNGGPNQPLFNNYGGTDGIITHCNGITSPANLPHGKACSGDTNVVTADYFMDSGNSSVDTVTISGTAYDTYAPTTQANSVAFSGVQIYVIWQNCNAGEHTENGKCVPGAPEVGTIQVNSVDAVTGAPVNGSWTFPAPPGTDPCSVASCSGASSETYNNMPVGAYTILAPDPSVGAPAGYTLKSIDPSVSQTLGANGTITFTTYWQPNTVPLKALLLVSQNNYSLAGAATAAEGQIYNGGLDDGSGFSVSCLLSNPDFNWIKIDQCPPGPYVKGTASESQTWSFHIVTSSLPLAQRAEPTDILSRIARLFSNDAQAVVATPCGGAICYGQVTISGLALAGSSLDPFEQIVDVSYSPQLPSTPIASFAANGSHQTTITAILPGNINYSWSSANGSTYSVYLDVLDASGNHATDPLGNTSGFICQDVGLSDTCKNSFSPVSGGASIFALNAGQAGYTYKWTYTVKNAAGAASDWAAIKVAAPASSVTYTVTDTTNHLVANSSQGQTFMLGDGFQLDVKTSPSVGSGKNVYICIDSEPSGTGVPTGCPPTPSGTTDAGGSLNPSVTGVWPSANTSWLGSWTEHAEVVDPTGNRISSPLVTFTLSATLVNRYSCSGTACISDPAGSFTDPNCNNSCGTGGGGGGGGGRGCPAGQVAPHNYCSLAGVCLSNPSCGISSCSPVGFNAACGSIFTSPSPPTSTIVVPPFPAAGIGCSPACVVSEGQKIQLLNNSTP